MAVPPPSSSPPPPNPRFVARVLFGGMLAAPILCVAVALGLRAAAPPPLSASPLIRYGILGFWLVAILIITSVRGRIPPCESDEQRWWGQCLPRLVLLWAVLEAVGIVAAVGYFLTADLLLLGLFLLGFLVPMALLTPGRLSGE